MNMTFDEYQKAALCTASMGLGAQTEMCIRALGLCGELVELKDAIHGADDTTIKEGGDVLWYAATLADMFALDGAKLGVIDIEDFDMVDFGRLSPVYIVERAQDAAGKLAELIKKHVGHGKPADPIKVAGLLSTVVSAVNAVMPCGMGLVAQANIAKLRARYPAGFDKAIASVKPDSDETYYPRHGGGWNPGPV